MIGTDRNNGGAAADETVCRLLCGVFDCSLELAGQILLRGKLPRLSGARDDRAAGRPDLDALRHRRPAGRMRSSIRSTARSCCSTNIDRATFSAWSARLIRRPTMPTSSRSRRSPPSCSTAACWRCSPSSMAASASPCSRSWSTGSSRPRRGCTSMSPCPRSGRVHAELLRQARQSADLTIRPEPGPLRSRAARLDDAGDRVARGQRARAARHHPPRCRRAGGGRAAPARGADPMRRATGLSA